MGHSVKYCMMLLLTVSIICVFTVFSSHGFEAQIKGVYFSSDNVTIQAIVKEMETATMEILVLDNSLVTASIARALITAHKRGVSVEVILDTTQRPSGQSPAGLLAKANIPIYIDSTHTITHSNIMIIDKSVVVTGSFNFHKAGLEKRSDNLLIITSGTLASKYIENWYAHRRHSRPLKGKF